MSLIKLLRLKTWETRLSKMPRSEMPRLETGTRITVAYGPSLAKTMFHSKKYYFAK